MTEPLDVVLKRFDSPDETRHFSKGRFDLIHIGGMTIGRATYSPGWKWSVDIGATLGQRMVVRDHVRELHVAVLGGEVIQGTCGTTEYNECATASDCTTCNAGLCGDYGTTCTTNADCASIGCTQFPFWTTFEQYLDKTRTGCSVK